MIYARHDLSDHTYRFLYSDKTHQNIEIFRIKSNRKTKGFLVRPLFNKKPHKISFTQNWLPMTLEFSKNTLTLKNHNGDSFFNFDARGEKPVMTVYQKNDNIFVAPEHGTITHAGILYIDKAKGHQTRTLMRGLTAFSQLMVEGYTQLEEGIPVHPVKNPTPSKIIVLGKMVVGAIADAISILEEDKPFNAYKNKPIQHRVRG